MPPQPRSAPGLALAFALSWAAGCSQDAAPSSSSMDSGVRPDARAPDAAEGGQPHTRRDASPFAAADASGNAADEGASSDAGPPRDAGEPAVPDSLAETGLYVPGSTSELAPGVLAFTPRYPLWSDGAEKRRWLLLPEGAQIDTGDMDAWRFPTGTKLWKEFAQDGKRLETRLLWKTDQGWYAVAFVWNEAETEAVAATRGAKDVRGTSHDVPRRTACGECHDGSPDFVLGASAIQLSHGGPGATLQSLAAAGTLSAAPDAHFALPDTPAWNALGYLHSNCGSCHNPRSITWDMLDLDLWLRVGELSAPEDTQSYETTLGVALTEAGGALELRVAPGDAAASGLVSRMSSRGDERAMPPLASEQVDEAGIALISRWIDDL